MEKQQRTSLHVKLGDMFARLKEIKENLKSNEAYCHHCGIVVIGTCNCDKKDLLNQEHIVHSTFVPIH